MRPHQQRHKVPRQFTLGKMREWPLRKIRPGHQAYPAIIGKIQIVFGQ
jgi:hypothetical protein